MPGNRFAAMFRPRLNERFGPVWFDPDPLAATAPPTVESTSDSVRPERVGWLNFPVRLNDKLTMLLNQAGGSDPRPTEAMKAVLKHLQAQVAKQLDVLKTVQVDLVPAFNKAAAEAPVPALVLPTPDDEGNEPEKSDR